MPNNANVLTGIDTFCIWVGLGSTTFHGLESLPTSMGFCTQNTSHQELTAQQ